MHTFYEAVGYMISAQTDRAARERLIMNCMELPNKGWDDIIAKAAQDVNTLQVCACVCVGVCVYVCWCLVNRDQFRATASTLLYFFLVHLPFMCFRRAEGFLFFIGCG